jgi:hypothetical protein
MASSWAENVPVVTVPRVETPKRVTLIYPYYNCDRFFHETQIQTWNSESYRALRPFVSVIVVDDGSPRPAMLPSPEPFHMRLFRIEVDVTWNWLAARNIGAHHAEDGWLVFTDMDHVIPAATLESIVYGQHDPGIVYAFSRVEHTGETIAPHSASFLMTRDMFWRIGGYDERFSGVYGTDGLYRRRVAKVAPFRVLTDRVVRYEFVTDSSVELDRKTPEMQAARLARLASVQGGQPAVLSFPYHEVAA